MHQALGLEGQSSDEAPDNNDVCIVREQDWKDKGVVRRYEVVKRQQATGFNRFGKRLPGTKPRIRVRRAGAAFTTRRAPSGLPINLYDPGWYASLTSREQEDLNAQEPIIFLTHPEDDVVV